MIFIINVTEYFSIPLVIPLSFPNTIISRQKREGNIERETNNRNCNNWSKILKFLACLGTELNETCMSAKGMEKTLTSMVPTLSNLYYYIYSPNRIKNPKLTFL